MQWNSSAAALANSRVAESYALIVQSIQIAEMFNPYRKKMTRDRLRKSNLSFLIRPLDRTFRDRSLVRDEHALGPTHTGSRELPGRDFFPDALLLDYFEGLGPQVLPYHREDFLQLRPLLGFNRST